jgi:hypothetical protein
MFALVYRILSMTYGGGDRVDATAPLSIDFADVRDIILTARGEIQRFLRKIQPIFLRISPGHSVFVS